MEDCAGNTIETISGRGEERDLFTQQMDELFHLAEQLEPVNLRQHDQETLNRLIVQLQTISQKIRHLPPEETHLLMSLRKDILKDLQEAIIELLLALDQYDAQGRTRRFYQCLSTCRSYLEHVMERKREAINPAQVITVERQLGTRGEDPIARIGASYKAIIHAQLALAQTSELLLSEDEIRHGNYSHLEQTLMVTRQPAQELYNTLRDASFISEEAPLYSYRLQVLLGYIDEQIQRLLELLPLYRKSMHFSAKQACKMRREITRKLELVQHRSNDLPLAIIALLDHVHPSGGGRRRLYLVEAGEG